MATRLAMELIRFPSVGSMSNRAVSEFLAERLGKLAFELELVTCQREVVYPHWRRS